MGKVDQLHSLPAMLWWVAAQDESAPAQRWHDGQLWQGRNYGELARRVKYLATALLAQGFKAGQRVALLAPNGPEWVVWDFALISAGLVSVPLHLSVNQKTRINIMRDAQVSALVVDPTVGRQNIEELEASFKRKKSFHSFLVQPLEGFDRPDTDQLVQQGKQSDDFKAYFASLESLEPDGLVTLMYTSGTTGEPKGVMLSHRNLLVNFEGGIERFVINREVYLSVLPLSHSFERTVHYSFLSIGSELCFVRSMDTIAQDLQELRPTSFAAVPRLIEKVHERIYSRGMSLGFFGRQFFSRAYQAAMNHSYGKSSVASPLYERLLFRKVRRRMGGRIRFIITGGGALDPQIARFFSGCGLPLVQGYGLTEAAPIVSANPIEANRFGTTGPPYFNVEAKLSEQAELLVKGANVFAGYWKQPEATAAVLNQEGWLSTGDLAEIDADGYITITGRIKDLLKTASGKNIMPLKIEWLLQELPWVEQVCLVGERRPFVVALIVVNPQAVNKILRKIDAAHQDKELAELVLDARAWPKFEADIEKINSKLSSYETIKRFALLDEFLTHENGLITPTLKIKRFAVAQKYEATCDALYGDAATIVEDRIPLLPRAFISKS